LPRARPESIKRLNKHRFMTANIKAAPRLGNDGERQG